MTRTVLFILVIATAATGLAAEPQMRFSKELDVPTIEREELVSVVLDSDVYAATRKGLPDVRLIDDEGNEVSFLLRKATKTEPRTERRTWSAEKPSVRPLDEGGLEITLQFDEKHRHDHPQGLRIISPLVNFERRVRVFDSEDGENWRPLVEDAVIFDYSQYMDVRNDKIEFPESDRDWFRVVIDDVTVEQQSQLMELTRRLRGGEETHRDERTTILRSPFRINRIEFWRDTVQEKASGDMKSAYPVSDMQTESNAEQKETIVYVDSRREPLTSLQLATPSRNFSRKARVEVERKQGQTSRWHTIGGATLDRLDFRNLKQEHLKVGFPEAREDRYRLVITNQNSPPLEATGIEGEGNVYEIVFLAAPKADYHLTYGSSDIKPPQYDVLAVTASLADGYNPVSATLGPAKETGATVVTESSAKRLINNPWVLGGAAALLVVVLGWGLYSASRRLDLPSDGGA